MVSSSMSGPMEWGPRTYPPPPDPPEQIRENEWIMLCGTVTDPLELEAGDYDLAVTLADADI